MSPGSAPSLSLGPAGDFLRCLWQLNHTIERVSRSMEKTIGVTAQQRMMIRCVGRFPGMTASQLAELLHLDAGTVSTALSRLERKHLLERRRSPRDRRRVTPGLTPAGHALDRDAPGTVEHAVVALLKTAAERDVASARAVLGELTALLARET